MANAATIRWILVQLTGSQLSKFYALGIYHFLIRAENRNLPGLQTLLDS